MTIIKKHLGNAPDGKEVYVFTLSNPDKRGITAEIMNFGGTILSLLVPDRNGRLEDVTLGYDALEDYFKKGPYFGAVIGRHANRIEGGEFEVGGKKYHVAKNDGANHLHGGMKGFDKVVWDAEIVLHEENESLQLTYRSIDGEENYPGNLDAKVTYTLSGENTLRIDYEAVTDKDTVINLTNHAYFNLSGHASGDILKHKLMINADYFTVINNEGIPTGEIRSVKDTPLDFTALTPIGQGISSSYEQMVCGRGYDHNWVLNTGGQISTKAAEVFDPQSGRIMEVYTTKPGIQFYSANFLDGSGVGKDGVVYNKWAGLCLETQYFPNALKHSHFPSPILKAGELYRHTTNYKFMV